MAKINLLPWREELRQTQKKRYIGVLVAIAIAVFILFWIIGQVFDHQIRNQKSRNNYLKQEIAILDQQIEQIKEVSAAKDAISLRMALIEQLQVSKNLTPILFNELAKSVPTGVSFRTMSRSDNRIKITGVTNSNNRLSTFIRAIDESDVFTNPELSSIVADRNGANAVSDFELTFDIAAKYGPLEAIESDKKED